MWNWCLGAGAAGLGHAGSLLGSLLSRAGSLLSSLLGSRAGAAEIAWIAC